MPRLATILMAVGPALVFAGNAWAGFVDCDTGGSIQAQINSGETLIEFTGICSETIRIKQDQTIVRGTSGDPTLDVIDGSVGITGADNVSLENLTITGSNVFVADGAFAYIRRSIIENTDFGFLITRSSGVRFIDSTMGPALVDDGTLSCGPICVLHGSTARFVRSTVTGNTNDPRIGGAFVVVNDSSVVLRGGNVIENLGTEPAIGLYSKALLRQDNGTGSGIGQVNGRILVTRMSFLHVGAGVISGDVDVVLHSVFRAGGPALFGAGPVTINGNITVSKDSAFEIGNSDVVVMGLVTCDDTESSFSDEFGVVGTNSCTGFNQTPAPMAPPGR